MNVLLRGFLKYHAEKNAKRQLLTELEQRLANKEISRREVLQLKGIDINWCLECSGNDEIEDNGYCVNCNDNQVQIVVSK